MVPLPRLRGGGCQLLCGGCDVLRCAVRLHPYPLTQGDEIGAGLHKRADFVQACRIADARHFEQLRPPRQALQDFVERGAAARAPSLTLPRTRGREMTRTLPRLRGREGWGWLAEHRVVGASLGREHGIMTAAQAAGAGDAFGLE